MSTQTIYLNGHGETCGPDTFILYVQQHSGSQFKLGKGGGESQFHGKTPLEAIRDGRYKGMVAYSYPIIFALSREYACQLMGKEYTEEMKHGNEMPKLDDWVRKQLGKPWGHNLGVRGAKKLGLDTEALLGHDLSLNEKLIQRVKDVLKLGEEAGRLEPTLRQSQVAIDAAVQAAFAKTDRVALIAYGGFGKSYLALRNASYLWQKEGDGYVLILTNVIDNIDDFKQASERFQFLGKRVEFMELSQLTATRFHKKLAECKKHGWIPVVAASTQNISGNTTGENESEEEADEILKKLDTKFRFLRDERLTALLQDEVHTHFAAEKTAQSLQKLHPKYTLDMTATMGRREMIKFGYSAEQIVSYSMLEALAAKRAGTDPDMVTMPDLDFFVMRNLQLPEKVKEVGATDAEGWCSSKAFSMEGGKLKHQRWALQIVEMTYALNVQHKSQLWKHAVTTVQNTGVHMMIVPSGGNGEGSASDKCRELAKQVNAKYGDEVHAIDAYELRALASRAGATLAEQVAKEIELHPNRKILIITHRVLLTGVNIPQLETIALFDRIGSSKVFMQTAYRLFRKFEYAPGEWKKSAKFFVFEPNVAIADNSAQGAIGGLLADVRDQGEQRVREMYDLIHLTVYDGAEQSKLSAGELLEAHDAAVKAEWIEKHAKVTETAVEAGLEQIKDALKGMPIIGKGISGGSGTDEKTQVTEDNGSKKLKPGEKRDKKSFEKQERDDWSKRLEIITSMLGQAKVFAAHRAWSGTLGENLDPVQVMSSPQVKATWGEANQRLVLEALKSDRLRAFMTEHLTAVNDGLLNSTLTDAIMNISGSVGPTQFEAGQSYWILDNQQVVDLLFKKEHADPKAVLVVHPKSGLVALEARRRWPDARIICLVMDDTFNDVLTQLGFEITLYRDGDTISNMNFDYIVGNPPYLDGLHIKIISKCLEQLTDGGVCVMIHPATEYIKQGRGAKNANAPKLLKHVTDISIVNPANIFPTATFGSPLAVAVFGSSCNDTINVQIDNVSFSTSNLEDISVHSATPGFLLFRTAMLGAAKNGSLASVVKWSKKGSYDFDPAFTAFVELSGYRGHTSIKGTTTVRDFFAPDFSTFAGSGTKVLSKQQLNPKSTKKYAFGFKTRNEADSFLSYIQTRTARAALFLFKFNQNVYADQLSSVPLVPFDRHWTDEMLYEHFKLTPEEIAFIEALPDHPQRGT